VCDATCVMIVRDVADSVMRAMCWMCFFVSDLCVMRAKCACVRKKNPMFSEKHF